jgi:hypothetical protein
VLLVGCVLDLFDVINVNQGAGMIAIAPGGLFELLLPIWLLAKGFSSSGHTVPSKRRSAEAENTMQAMA